MRRRTITRLPLFVIPLAALLGVSAASWLAPPPRKCLRGHVETQYTGDTYVPVQVGDISVPMFVPGSWVEVYICDEYEN